MPSSDIQYTDTRLQAVTTGIMLIEFSPPNTYSNAKESFRLWVKELVALFLDENGYDDDILVYIMYQAQSPVNE